MLWIQPSRYALLHTCSSSVSPANSRTNASFSTEKGCKKTLWLDAIQQCPQEHGASNISFGRSVGNDLVKLRVCNLQSVWMFRGHTVLSFLCGLTHLYAFGHHHTFWILGVVWLFERQDCTLNCPMLFCYVTIDVCQQIALVSFKPALPAVSWCISKITRYIICFNCIN